jgi:hypothetical protein
MGKYQNHRPDAENRSLSGMRVVGIRVVYNLALAVLIGMIISALVFAWENANRIMARKWRGVECNECHCSLTRPLFPWF